MYNKVKLEVYKRILLFDILYQKIGDVSQTIQHQKTSIKITDVPTDHSLFSYYMNKVCGNKKL